jgi:outer membrane protein insertion porin family
MKRISLAICLIVSLVGSASAQIRFGQPNQPSRNNDDISYSAPQRYTIGGIEIEGVRYLDHNALISIAGLKVGDEISVPGEEISGAIKKLWDQGLLSDVAVNASRIEGSTVFLTFDLKERPRLAKFSFKGIKKGQADDLKNKVNLVRGRIVTDAMLKNAQNTVRKHFVEKGYLNTEVRIVQVDDTLLHNSVALRIEVDRKNRVKINDIYFDGNEVFTEKQLRRKLKDTKERRPYRIFKASKFIRSKFEEDKEKLIAFYNAQGYRDAHVIQDTVYTFDDRSVNVGIKINEGIKYYFRDITWTGNYVYTDQVLTNVLGIKKGDVYNLENLQKRLQYDPTGKVDVSSLYLDDGYLFFNVEPIEVSIDGDSIDVEMRMMEGTQANINRVTVAGNTKTNDHVILREIRTLPGQKFSRTALIRSQREIAQLGYFDPEQIGINPVPNPSDGTVDINYTVVERPSDQIELSGGWGGFFGFVGTLGVTFNNFSIGKVTNWREWKPLPSGDGQRLSLRLQANGRQFQTYSASFVEPWLGGRKRNSFSVSLTHSSQAQLEPGNFRRVMGSLQVTGLTVGLGRMLTVPDDYFSLSNSLSVQRYTLDNFQSMLGSALGSDVAGKRIYNQVTFNTTISRNSIDNPTFPSRGSSLSLAVNATPPYSRLISSFNPENGEVSPVASRWVEFHKWMFDASWFIQIMPKLVINTRSHAGFIGSYGGAQPGPFDRFQMGGDGITGFNFLLGTDIIGLRGYENLTVGDLQRDAEGRSLRNQFVGGGGVAFSKYVTELRYAVSTNPAATIFVLGFAEAGNNWSSLSRYNPFDMRRSAGVGARIFMPAFGMIGVDYGFGFDPIPGMQRNKNGQFHFTIGQQIR